MAKTYPTLPKGPVTCELCAKSGRHVEMHRHELGDSYLKELPLEAGTELQSYRCPECENISVFCVK